MSGLATVKTASPLTVTLDSGDTELPAQRLTTYTTPVVDDRVAWLRTESGLIILGKVV